MLKNLILGTAGHIDHGKTSLIGALTGTNTDRLPEEKKRGITIELGYAHLDLPPYRMGVVDVPGHEKFVRQMLAGATGMDMVLLVIAGDDSVKQQTTEHLDILRLLDLPAGVIALTKCDLVEDDWLDLVEEEVRQLVSDTFLHDAPIVRTSAKSGVGINELKQALLGAAERVAASERANLEQAPFRMAVDRSFTIKGHGTVVTGSVNSGSLSVGDDLVIQPGNTSVRVRRIQNHDAESEQVARGQRAAINLAGVHHEEIGRGHELATPGHLVPSRLMTVQLHLLESASRPLKDRSRIRFHIGTAELFGNVRLMDQAELQPGQSGLAQVYLNEPAVGVWNQPFVIRHQSPVETIGGGRVLAPNALRIRKATDLDLTMMRNLSSQDPVDRASAAVFLTNRFDWKPEELARQAGIVDVQTVVEALESQSLLRRIPISQTRHITVHRDRFEQLAQRMLKSLARMHEAQPLRFHHPRHAMNQEFAYLDQPELVASVVEHLKREKQVVANVNSIGLVGYGPQLSKGQKALLEELVSNLRQADLEPPSVDEMIKAAKKNKESVAELLEMAAENGDLIRAADGFYLHANTVSTTRQKLFQSLEGSEGMTMSELRQLLGVSRKYAVPILEYFDRLGFTRREGDLRFLGPDAQEERSAE